MSFLPGMPAFEPFRIKTIEPIHLTTREQRRRLLIEVEHNLFRLRAEHVMIDLLTDSGTGAMSANQWSAMMRGDESYAGSASFYRLADAIERITGFPHMLPTHQGRVAERLLVEVLIGKSPARQNPVVPNNAHFDTTRSMIEAAGAEAANLLTSQGETATSTADFKGDIDLRKLERLLQSRRDDVPFVMMTLTCNSNGGQPVSLENLRRVREICDQHEKLLILDACRFAENAWFIRQREAGRRDQQIAAIVREQFDLADGVVMSTRKDALCNSGGLLLLRDEQLHRKACKLCVLTEGFQMSYGSLPARDLEAIAVGLDEAIDESFLTSRIGQVAALANRLSAAGIPMVEPAGGHAIFIDAEDFCPHLARADNPAHSLACAIYEHGGIRCSRIGSALRNQRGLPMELVRLAIPRRCYSSSHLEHVARTLIDLKKHSREIRSVKIARPAMLHSEESAITVA